MRVDMEQLEALGIGNLHPVFGRGARGETLARRGLAADAFDRLGPAGVAVVVDLRTADHNERLAEKCRRAGLGYLHVPVDAHATESEDLLRGLPDLFRVLDGDGFYISCQQGRHRTDIALALYYFYHNPDLVPDMVGHRTKGFLRCDDIMRRINAMRPFFPETDESDFAERRKRFLAFNRVFPVRNAPDERRPTGVGQTKTEESK